MLNADEADDVLSDELYDADEDRVDEDEVEVDEEAMAVPGCCGGRARQRSGEREGEVVMVGMSRGASEAWRAAKGDRVDGHDDEGDWCASPRKTSPAGAGLAVGADTLTGRGGTAGGMRGLGREGKARLGEGLPPPSMGEPRGERGVLAPAERASPVEGGGEGVEVPRSRAMARIHRVGLVSRLGGAAAAWPSQSSSGLLPLAMGGGELGLAVRDGGFGGIGGRYEVRFAVSRAGWSGGGAIEPRRGEVLSRLSWSR